MRFETMVKEGYCLPLTRRVDIELGYTCNERCLFCYYLKKIKSQNPKKDLSTTKVKRLLRLIRKKGIEIIDFSGGEPTIRKDLIEIVSYAKGLGFRSICIITNGIILANMDYARRLIEAGVDDFLFSLHGPDPRTHDKLTAVGGSFDQIIRAIQNIKQLGAKCRTNTVVNSLNFDKMEAVTELLVRLEIQTVNFIFFNPVFQTDQAQKDMTVSYARAVPYLKRAIDNYASKISKLTIRYLPFCLMQGYEKHIVNIAQRQYDLDEWDYFVRTQVRNGRMFGYAALYIGLFLLLRNPLIYGYGWDIVKLEAMNRFLEFEDKLKGPQCKRCRYDKICDGLWKNYVRRNGFGEFQPVAGEEKITDPTYFMRQ